MPSDFVNQNQRPQRAVSISRKDTIIIAMLVNIALLAVLFATASRQTHSQPVTKPKSVVAPIEQYTHVELQVEPAQVVVAKQAPVDEIDEILKNYTLKTEQQPPVAPAAAPVAAQAPQTLPSDCFEITVQKGDALSKIARRYNVKIEEIILLNHLESAKLKIGQTLKIPKTANQQLQPTVATEPEYYIVQSGDSPWKIARKCHIKTEDLLRLNNLDEEKARNLKIGQKLRIR